ncbi:hypothetical protein L0N33_25805, partial [Roseburia faecis]|nr:hypothetical protein [Roseburia faecis]
NDEELTKSNFYQKQLLPVLQRELKQIHADFVTLTHQAQAADLTTTSQMLADDAERVEQLLKLTETGTWDA